ncbi:MAG: hypothetical protein IKO42_05625 [Opitutales bacterium]|nr:hypothetical protein [Opitutales bacterium]
MEENNTPQNPQEPNNAPQTPEASKPSVQIRIPKIKLDPNMFSELVEKLVAVIKNFASPERLSAIIERMRSLATWVITVMVVVIPVVGIVVAIRGGSIDPLLTALGVSVALVFCQFIAKGFISSMNKLLGNASAKLTTDTIPNAFGLISIGLGIASLACSFRAFQVSFESGIGCILAALALLLLGCIYMTPKMVNVQIEENNTPAQDFIGIWSFILNGVLAVFPLFYLLFGAYTIALLLKSLFAAESDIAVIYFGVSVSAAFATALLPLIFYLLYISYYLIVDLIKAVLSIPQIGKDK